MKTIKFYIAALLLMVCSAANAQVAEPYLNVEISTGVYKSFKVTENLKVSWGQIKETTGKAKAIVNNNVVDVPWVQLWEGGPKFAEYNVGVIDGHAWSYGGYYCWGGSIDQDMDLTYNNGTDKLSGTDDTATKLWGANWRMPTLTEYQALRLNCDVVMKTVNGINGYEFTGKNAPYNSNSIFLPAAGAFSNADKILVGVGSNTRYWSCTPTSTDYLGQPAANMLSCTGLDKSPSLAYQHRTLGYSVRAVLAE